MLAPSLDRELMSLHRASVDVQVPIRKAAHTEQMNTGANQAKAARGPSSSPSSYKQSRK